VTRLCPQSMASPKPSPDTHAPSAPAQDQSIIRQCLLDEFRQATREALRECACLKGRDAPLTPSMVSVGILCNSIEMVLKHGLRAPVNEPAAFWWLVREAVNGQTGNARLASAVQVVERLTKVTTATGKGRSFIRHALNSGSLAELLTAIIEPEGPLAQHRAGWYQPWALAQHEEGGATPGIATPLAAVRFRLPVDDAMLDHAFVVPNKGEDDTPSRRVAPSLQGFGSTKSRAPTPPASPPASPPTEAKPRSPVERPEIVSGANAWTLGDAPEDIQAAASELDRAAFARGLRDGL